MSGLQRNPGFFIPGEPSRHAHTAGDRFYEALVAAHEGLSDAQSDLLQARLVLLRFGTPRRFPELTPELAPELAVPGVRSLWIVPVAAARGIEGNDWLVDCEGLAAQRCDACAGTCYLIRPDQHVVARWRAFDPSAVQAALARALGQGKTV